MEACLQGGCGRFRAGDYLVAAVHSFMPISPTCSPFGCDDKLESPWGYGSLIFNLQIVRALAAIGVVIYHIDYHFVEGVHTDFLGVATFFVLSGFIMCYITKDEADSFLSKRLIRIVPLYWLVTFLRVAILNGWNDVGSIVRSLLFLPSDQPPLVGVGWTLNFEIYFYVIFAVAVWIRRAYAPLIAAGILLAVMQINVMEPGNFLARYYSHDYIRFFLGGIALFYVWRLLPLRMLPKGPSAVLGVAIVTMCYAVQTGTEDLANWRSTLPVLIVGTALLMERAGADLKFRPLVLLGDSSYALYLTHTLFMGSIRRIFPDALELARTNVVWFIGMLMLCIIVGIGVHLIIEKPILRLLQERLRRRTVFA
jgi:exopolysaccharide production protein ExoZ